MEKILVYHYDAFSVIPNKGNPAGVVISEDYLTDNQMQEIAKKIGFNETAFVVKSDKANLGIRYFTPGHEMNLCGHATVATLFCLKSRGILRINDSLTIETKAGILPIELIEQDNNLKIKMGQSTPQFKEYHGSIEKLAEVIGIGIEDFDLSFPILYGNTGTWTLLVPISKLETFSRMIPKNELFPSVLKELPTCSIHPFCFETIKPYAHMHSRHFSSPYSGTVEDPVTGTASGVMGAYYATYKNTAESELELIMEQGQEINRDGEVFVHITKQEAEIRVSISGTAVYIKDMLIEYS
jgi:trans-2,3-dihydro-3-hydroxyanthranilate isomerase